MTRKEVISRSKTLHDKVARKPTISMVGGIATIPLLVKYYF
jgi:hypothetical protein